MMSRCYQGKLWRNLPKEALGGLGRASRRDASRAVCASVTTSRKLHVPSLYNEKAKKPPVQFSQDQRVKLHKDTSRVCIVGGGPAGLHMAAELTRKGVKNVTVLDKYDRTCGKVETITHNGTVHELGACWLSSSYSWVRQMMVEYDVSPENRKEKGIGKTRSRDIITKWNQLSNPTTVDLSTWMFAEVEKETIDECLWPIMPDEISALTVFKAFEKYKLKRKLIIGDCDYNFPPEPKTQEHRRLLSLPLLKWLKEEDLEAMKPFLAVAQTAQGYGFTDEVPTYYALYWLTPELINGYLKFMGGKILLELAENVDQDKLPPHVRKVIEMLLSFVEGKVEPVPTLLVKGWEPVIRALQKEPFKTILNAEVIKIDRSGSVARVTYQHPTKLDPAVMEETVMDCDLVILASPVPQLLSALDASDKETKIFGALKPVTIVTHLIDADDPLDPKRQALTSWPYGLERRGQGSVYTLKNSMKAVEDKEGPDPTSGSFSFVTYQLYDDPQILNGREPSPKITEQMKKDVVDVYGIKNVDMIKARGYKYFYHFRTDDVAKGYPWEVLKMQGLNKTLYVGCSVCFESVNDLVAHNKLLLDHLVDVV